jgi:hypothetical protein
MTLAMMRAQLGAGAGDGRATGTTPLKIATASWAP